MILNTFFYNLYTLFTDMAPYLLFGLIFVGLLHIMFSKEFITKHIGEDNFLSVVKSSFIGVPLPLCSCGVVPTAVFMAKNGASKGAVISFLISTPQTGIDSIAATYGMLGWIFAIYRPLVAFVMGIVGGLIVNFFGKGENHLAENLETADYEHHHHHENEHDHEHKASCNCIPDKKESKLKKMFSYAFVEFLDDISLDFIIGLLISALIGVFLPENFFSAYNINGIYAMILMIIIGIPMYICATTSIPIAVILMLKGLSPGAAFVFLAVGPATNAASIAILLKILGKKIMLIYLSAISLMAIFSGVFLDFIFKYFKIDAIKMIHSGEVNEFLSYFSIFLSLIFLILLIFSIYRKYFKK